MKTLIGVDLGGTNIRAAKVDEEGNILQMVKDVSEPDKGAEHVMSKMIELIERIDGYEECEGIGMGIPGPIDTIHGKIIVSTYLPKLVGYPIVEHISKHFNKPTFIDNDVKVATLGEACLGAGKEYPIVYYVTISTGIGGALSIDKKVLSGQNGHAGEIGNICIDRNRNKYNIFNVGAVEIEASGTAITRKGKEVFGDTIQHAGTIIGIGGIAGHAFLNMPRSRSGYLHKASLQMDLSAVTAACMMMKRTVFESLDGFEEALTVAFNDVDLCLRCVRAGYLVVYNPRVELYHYESKSRGSEDSEDKVRRFQQEIEFMRTRWIDLLKQGDPYYNKNLTLSKWNYSLRA